MKTPRGLCLLTLSLVLLQSTGCFSHRPILHPRPGIYDRVVVTTKDGTEAELYQVQIDSLAIRGYRTGSGTVEIPMENVGLIEEPSLNMLKTAGLVALVSGGLLVWYVARGLTGSF